MLCPHCQKQIADNDRFRRYCGSAIPEALATATGAGSSEASPTGEEPGEINIEDRGRTGGKRSRALDDDVVRSPERGMGARAGATGVAAVLFVAMVLFGWGICGCDRSEDANEGPTYTEREQLAWRAVHSHLKAPSTASMRFCKEMYRNPVNDRGLVLVSVDAENSFGAMIRTCFYVVFIPGEKPHIDKVSCPPTEMENIVVFATYGIGEGDE